MSPRKSRICTEWRLNLCGGDRTVIVIMLATLTKAARAGGEELKKYFGSTLTQNRKGEFPHNFATEADYASEQAMLAIIEKEMPGYNILAEESGKVDKGSEYTVVIDPLDGTYNFFHKMPLFSTIAALQYRDKTIAGVVYNPVMDLMYFAELGKGSFCNGQKIETSNITDISHAGIGFLCEYDTPRKLVSAVYDALYTEGGTERFYFNWSPGYDFCQLASGAYDGMVVVGGELYDFLAGQLIAKEAGATITKFGEEGDTNPRFIISAPGIHEELIAKMRDILSTL